MTQTEFKPGAYSRLVGYLKIALPLLAIALLSTVFLVQQEDEITGGIVFTQSDRDTVRDGLTMHNPKFSGVNLKGDRFYVEAERATPDGAEPKEVALKGVDGRTDYVSGLSIFLSAARGTAYIPEQKVRLEGGLTIRTSDGYEGVTDAGVAGLKTGSFVSDGPVTLTGPTGTIEAGSLRIETLKEPKDNSENQVFWFEKDVKLVFQPSS